jgi:hypothetical protein
MNEGCGIPGGESVKVWITAFRMEIRDETDGRFKAVRAHRARIVFSL